MRLIKVDKRVDEVWLIRKIVGGIQYWISLISEIFLTFIPLPEVILIIWGK